jgi:hypothetical protein
MSRIEVPSMPPRLGGPSGSENGLQMRNDLRNDMAIEESNGPSTMAWTPEEDTGSHESGDSDPYFAELRRAINGPEPLGPRIDAESAGIAGTDEDDDEFHDPEFADGRRFGGRLRRRR